MQARQITDALIACRIPQAIWKQAIDVEVAVVVKWRLSKLRPPLDT
jgi:hypothetical protein